MVIPIPSKRKRFQLSLGIKAKRAMMLGIMVYDPGVPYTDYFRRRVIFRANSSKGLERDIQIKIPVSPNHLVMELYDKETLGSGGFKITRFELNELPVDDTWASPERHRFMDFAMRFAQKAGYAKPGFYESADHEFLIQYLPTIRDDFGNELVTPARIHRQMPRVQLSRKMFRRFTVPVRIAILSHEGCHFFMNTRSERNADFCGLQYYLDYGFPKIEAAYAATKVFNQHRESVGKPHVDRTRDIIEFIDQYTVGKELVV